jgi:phytoene dehydrogenase-like protein
VFSSKLALMQRYDAVIVGGGHNGLTAAAYLAKAGKSVLVLERLDYLGGAATSSYTFDGVGAKLSRYSYLVSLLPQQIIDDLGLEIKLIQRRYSSYTPVPGEKLGLLIDRHDSQATRSSFSQLNAEADFEAWGEFYSRTERIAQDLFPTVLEPLKRRSEVRSLIGSDFEPFFEQPIGLEIEKQFSSDLVRGVVLTDALIGTFAPNLDQNLDANRCFLYHVIGGGTGDWNIPVGGMGQVSGSIASAAKRFGAELVSGAHVTAISSDKVISYNLGDTGHQVSADWILSGVSQTELARLTGRLKPEQVQGAQVKVNILLKRLPKLKDSSVSPDAGFGGTFHINETYEQLQSAFEAASRGEIPDPLPCEIYCHSLTDPTILDEKLRSEGAQTMTVFALHMPHSLTQHFDNEELRAKAQAAVLKSLNSVLAEPIEDLIYMSPSGEPCIETKTTLDLEQALGLPGGNIFHSPLSWPFAEDEDDLSTPAKRWGVDTGLDGIVFCGSSAKRGGAVSGIGGHNAAMAILES